MKTIWLLLVAVLLAACNFSVSANRGVEIEGGQSIQERAAFAESVAAAVRASDLGEAVLAECPSLSTADLNGLSVTSKLMVSKEATGDERGRTDIFVHCSFKYNGDFDIAEGVVELCKKHVEATVNRLREDGARRPTSR